MASLGLLGLANNYDIQNYIIWIFSAYFALVMVVKMVFVLIYLLQYFIAKKIKVTLMASRTRQSNWEEGRKLKQMFLTFVDKMK